MAYLFALAISVSLICLAADLIVLTLVKSRTRILQSLFAAVPQYSNPRRRDARYRVTRLARFAQPACAAAA